LNRGALVNNNKFTKQSYTSPLLESAKRNDVDMTMLLISRGADTEFRDLHGRTVLFHAVITGSVDVMAILIKNGSNVNAVENKRRFTPLHFAYRLGYRSAIKILIEASADENARDYKGRSPGDVKNTKILPEKEYVD
jgi:ankyrin repeat protein